MSGPRLPLAAAVLGVTLLGVLGPLVAAPWLWDDKTLIVESPVLADRARWPSAPLSDFWGLSDNPREGGMFRPLVVASYVADRAAWGRSPVPPHVENLLLHLLVVALAGLWVASLAGREAGLWGAALFGLHPVAVEAVANVSSRADLLATAFVLGALLLLPRPGRVPAGLSVLFAVLAMASKESAFTLPALAVWSVWVRRQKGLAPVPLARLVAPVVVALLALVARRAVLSSGVRFTLEGWSALEGPVTAGRYLTTWVWPTALVPYSPHESAWPWLHAAVLLVAVGVAVAARRRTPWPLAAMLFFLLASAPVARWLPIDVRFSGLLLYLPSLGLVLGVAALAEVPRARWGLGALVLALAVFSSRSVPQWSDDASLWAANVEAWPELAAPRVNLANALVKTDPAAATAEYERALQLAEPQGDGHSLALAAYGLGTQELAVDPARAAGHLQRAVEVSKGRLWQAGLNLGVALAQQRKWSEADAALEQQWQHRPVDALAVLGGKVAEASGDAERLRVWRERRAP